MRGFDNAGSHRVWSLRTSTGQDPTRPSFGLLQAAPSLAADHPESAGGETGAGTAARIATPVGVGCNKRQHGASGSRGAALSKGAWEEGGVSARGPTPLTLYRNLRSSGSAFVPPECRRRAARDGTGPLRFRFVPSRFRDEYASVTSGHTIGLRDRCLDCASIPLCSGLIPLPVPPTTGGAESHNRRLFAAAKRGERAMVDRSAGRGRVASMGLPAELLNVTNRPMDGRRSGCEGLLFGLCGLSRIVWKKSALSG